MKKFLAITFVAALTLSINSCGPSAEEKKADSLTVDSTAKGMTNEADRMIDSMNKADSMNNVMMKHVQDSTHMADSIAKLKKK